MEQYCRAGQAIHENMAHAHCVLDTYGYKYTHSGCIIFIAFPLQRYAYIACLVNVCVCVCLEMYRMGPKVGMQRLLYSILYSVYLLLAHSVHKYLRVV